MTPRGRSGSSPRDLKTILESVPKRRREDAIWLLSALLGVSRAEILLEARRELTPGQAREWNGWWRRRLKGEPMQYISASAPFYGREFFVDRRVLIPRPETEMLVELALRHLPRPGTRVLDIGTGSGCIAITLKLERPDLDVTGSDVSPDALAVAGQNAHHLGAEVRFEEADLFSAGLRAEPWDLVVSNPPYLAFARDKVAADVKRWEPKSALEPSLAAKVAGAPDWASWCAERILLACAESPPRLTVLELSARVASALERRWRKHPAAERVWREADLAGRKRFLLVAWKRHG